jgi:sialidase-1
VIQQFTVSRDDEIYEAFPDVAAPGGDRLVCVFTETTHHGDRAYSRVASTVSENRGRTWSDRRYVTDPLYQDDGDDPHWNNPRVTALSDGRLVVVVDRTHDNWLWTSTDGGETWDGPATTAVDGYCPDQVVELSEGEHAGRWLVTATKGVDIEGERGHAERAWTSDDGGDSWAGPYTVAQSADLELCEGSVVELPGGELACFMRENSGTGRDAYKSVSRDGGETWTGPHRFPLPGCHRPVAGTLQSGDVFITHRFMQGGDGWLGSWTQNLFGGLTDVASCLATARGDARTRIVPIDYDRSAAADTGYTGWVQFDDGEIYVVNYIVDDAPSRPVREPPAYEGEYDDVPKAYIRGYAVHERDLRLDA